MNIQTIISNRSIIIIISSLIGIALLTIKISPNDIAIQTYILITMLFTWGLGLIECIVSHRSKKSQFYLAQIKESFSKGISLLSESQNSNLKWHQAISHLKLADNLMIELQETPHKHICFYEYLNTGYFIQDVIDKIDDFRFYYGLPHYKTQNSEELYHKSTPMNVDGTCTRIHPDELLSLCAFMNKVTKAYNDQLNEEKEKSWENTFNSAFFKKTISQATLSDFSTIQSNSIKMILKYVSDYKNQSSKNKSI